MAAAIQQELLIFSSSNIRLPIAIRPYNPMRYYQPSAIINSVMESNQQPDLQNEISRILSSNSSKQMVSQLKRIAQADNKIEQELKNKTMQISQLQQYLRGQIENIHKIVDENQRLKKQLDGAKVEMGRQKLENEALERQLELVVGNNKKYGEQVGALERRNIELMTEVRNMKQKRQGREEAVQTEEDRKSTTRGLVSCSANTSPQLSKHNEAKLLDKISQLEQAVNCLRLEKSELQAKLHSYQNNDSASTPNESSIQDEPEPCQSAHIRSTAQIIQLICQDTLQQIKFRGEMVNNLKQGRGVCLYQEHVHYEGHFHQGKRHGLGVLYHLEQEIYRGYWFNGLIQGKGILHMLEGQIETYQGQFFQGRLEGYGCMTLKSGKKVLGIWQDGKIKGNCIQSDHNGKRYTKPELIHCY